MAYRLLADAVLVLHGAFILFAVLGGLWVLRRPKWIWLHLPAFLWAGFIELSGGICPLTPLENRLRVLGGAGAYRGDFIDRYLMSWIYPDELTRVTQIVLGLLVIAFNALLYGLIWTRIRRRR
jgi:hypothetical protein